MRRQWVMLLCLMMAVFPASAQERDVSKSPMAFDLARVEPVINYKPSASPPYIDHLISLSLEDKATQWMRENLQALGQDGVMKFEVHEASVTESFYQGKPHLLGLVGGTQYTEYSLSLVVVMKVYQGGSLLPAAEVTVDVSRRGAIETEDDKQAHEQFLKRLAGEMMQGFDAEARRQISNYFADYMAS
jgi:hypothetical protein